MKANQDKYWTAFYTKPRSEKKTAERLIEKGFDIFCPTRTVLKQWSDRKKKIQEPLFTSYIFAQIDENERQVILKDRGIVASVKWLKRPVNIPQKEIDMIKVFLGEFPEATLTDNVSLNIGDRVVIKDGIFKGTEGNVFRVKGNTVVLFLQSLNQYLHAELSIHQVNSIE